jgi:hypothetical protein
LFDGHQKQRKRQDTDSQIKTKPALLSGTWQLMDGGQAMDFGASTLKAKLLPAFCQFFDDRTW